MTFNETTNRSGIIQQTERLCDFGIGYISGDTNNLKDFTVYANITNNELVTIIHENSGSWQYDDSSQSNLPRATSNLASGTNKYAIPSEAFTINKIEVKDQAGNWIKLAPLTIEKENVALSQLESQTGTPTHYMLYADTIQFYPTPDYSQDASYRVFYDRGSVDFASTDTTKTPGILSSFHYLYPLGMSIMWLKIKQPNSPSLLRYEKDYELGKIKLAETYANRWKDNTPTIVTKKSENFE